jgi:hypothetical protein
MRKIHTVIVVAAMLAFWGVANAQDANQPSMKELLTTVEALKARLKDQGNRLAEVEGKTAESQKVDKAELEKVIKELVADANKKTAIPGWLDNLKFGGDFRLRYEYNGFNWGKTEESEKKDRNRARYRVRLGVIKTWLDDQIEVGFRLASGSDNDATSTNQTFTQDFSKKPVWIDLAYARYSPKDLKGFTVIGGKMTRPWIENDIFFDTDVNPEGVWAEYKAPKMGCVEPFVGAGYFIVNESADGEDSTMHIAQAGVKFGIAKDVKYTLAANYQEWTDYFASGATPRGNDSKLNHVPGFRIFNISNNLDIASLCGRPLNVFADFAHNCGEADEADGRYDGQNNAYAVGIKYGQNKEKGDWSIKYRYAHIEANALPGHFVDSDFGYANRKGHVLGGEYNVLDSMTIGLNLFLTQPIFSPTSTSGSSPYEDLTFTVMADMVWKF